MAYSKRIPPIKIKLNVDEYNKLLEILENMIDEIGNIPINTNYYEVLLSVREKIKKSKMSEE